MKTLLNLSESLVDNLFVVHVVIIKNPLTRSLYSNPNFAVLVSQARIT